MNLIIGLGNPGIKYQKTRHNAGFLAIDEFAKIPELACETWRMNKKFNAEISQSKNHIFLLAKPHTYMNESGKTAQSILAFYKIPIKNLFVLHDDLDLPFGSFKIQYNRGSAGHNGVESIFTRLGTREFTRVRIGVANGEQYGSGTDFVLKPFKKSEQKELPSLFQKIHQQILASVNSSSL